MKTRNEKANYSNDDKGKTNSKDRKDKRRDNKRNGNSINSGVNRSNRYSTPDRQERTGTYDNIRSNDISWYNKSVIYPDAVRVPFNRIPGAVITTDQFESYGEGSPVEWDYTAMAPAGVARIEYVPTIGVSMDNNSAVNRCFTSIYADIYSKTTGAMQFQQADLALLSLGMSSILNTVAQIKRALGLSLLFADQNYYYPKALVHACGVNFESISGKQDQVRMKLNEYISNINGMKLPAFIDLFKRSYQLGLNVYADEDEIRAQYYTFVPEGYYVYRDTGVEGISDVSMLEYKTFNRSLESRTIDIFDLLDVLREQLESWRQSSDLGLISGSIARAYSEQQLIYVEHCPVDYVCIPVYDEVMMWQINNATLCTRVMNDSMHITQGAVANALYSMPRLEYNRTFTPACMKVHMLNSYNNKITDDFIMEATRLKVCAEQMGENPEPYVTVCGSEIPTNIYIYQTVEYEGEIKILGWNMPSVALFGENPASNQEISDALWTLSEYSRFRNAPRVYLFGADEAVTKYMGTPFGYGDLYRYTTIDEEALRGLMLAATQSIFVVNVRTDIK